MIERYAKYSIDGIWSDLNKLSLWQKVELALIQAHVNLGNIPNSIFEEISKIWKSNQINIVWWKERDKIIHHDLNAFIEERLRHLPQDLQLYVHKKITSFDTEEAPFARMILKSLDVILGEWMKTEETLENMALKYRYTIMNGRTHGQEAELQTFGKRCLTWIKDLRLDFELLNQNSKNLKYSKLSGAIGNYGAGIDPEIEKETLKILGFKPYYGATQIMPREIYAPVAQALCQIVMTLNKIAIAIRLGARSGRPIFQEPFSKKQKGSSAMPHKKNTIRTEQIEGMARLADGYLSMIMNNISTWEERAIEQSCVERVAWPDLFHVAVHSLEVMNKVLRELKVYPENMMFEIMESRGCYASSEAKEFLKESGVSLGLTAEDGYRIIQLAAFNVFDKRVYTEGLSKSLVETDEILERFREIQIPRSISIQEIIRQDNLYPMADKLDATEKDVLRWNNLLKKIFSIPKNSRNWDKLFQPSYLLKNEAKLFQEILGK